jgi:hypothetical protein
LRCLSLTRSKSAPPFCSHTAPLVSLYKLAGGGGGVWGGGGGGRRFIQRKAMNEVGCAPRCVRFSKICLDVHMLAGREVLAPTLLVLFSTSPFVSIQCSKCTIHRSNRLLCRFRTNAWELVAFQRPPVILHAVSERTLACTRFQSNKLGLHSRLSAVLSFASSLPAPSLPCPPEALSLLVRIFRTRRTTGVIDTKRILWRRGEAET